MIDLNLLREIIRAEAAMVIAQRLDEDTFEEREYADELFKKLLENID